LGNKVLRLIAVYFGVVVGLMIVVRSLGKTGVGMK
jgi:tetrahydromethanopterin S-methyltransferase subunit G